MMKRFQWKYQLNEIDRTYGHVKIKTRYDKHRNLLLEITHSDYGDRPDDQKVVVPYFMVREAVEREVKQNDHKN